VHHTAPDRGEQAKAFFNDCVEIIEFVQDRVMKRSIISVDLLLQPGKLFWVSEKIVENGTI
jgi:hypothetical protein